MKNLHFIHNEFTYKSDFEKKTLWTKKNVDIFLGTFTKLPFYISCIRKGGFISQKL